MGFVNTIQNFASMIVWLWTVALPQPVQALFAFAFVGVALFALFKILWGLI